MVLELDVVVDEVVLEDVVDEVVLEDEADEVVLDVDVEEVLEVLEVLVILLALFHLIWELPVLPCSRKGGQLLPRFSTFGLLHKGMG